MLCLFLISGLTLPHTPGIAKQSLNHWTSRGSPQDVDFILKSSFTIILENSFLTLLFSVSQLFLLVSLLSYLVEDIQ